MYGWIVNRLRNAEGEHIKNGEDKLAVLCRDAASVVVELNTRNKTLRALLHDRDTTIDSLNVSLETYRGLTEAMQHNQQAQWIPVTEQKPPLPEDEDVCYVQVIGAVKGKKEAEPVLYSRAYRLRDGKRVRIERFVGDGEVLEVSHWMLMPEPPQPPKVET